MFSWVVMVDGRPIRGASSKPRSGSLNSTTQLATVRYDGAESLQTLSSSLLISVVFSPFRIKKLYDCSMLYIQHFSKMKTHGPQNVIFSYEENEPTGLKLVYLNKDPPSIE